MCSEKSRGLKKEPWGIQTWAWDERATGREDLGPTSSEVSGRIGEGSVTEAVTMESLTSMPFSSLLTPNQVRL